MLDACSLCGELAELVPMPAVPPGRCEACALLTCALTEDPFRLGFLLGAFHAVRTLGHEGPAARRAVLRTYERLSATPQEGS